MANPRGGCGQHDAAMVMRTTFAQDSSALLGLLGAVVGLLIGEGLDTGRSNRNAPCRVLTGYGHDLPDKLVAEISGKPPFNCNPSAVAGG